MSPWRGTRDRHDGCSESSSQTRQDDSSSRAQRCWGDIPYLPDYDEEIDWRDDSTAAGRLIPPTSMATVSEETGTVIKNACTVRLEHADCIKTMKCQLSPSRGSILDSSAGQLPQA